MEQEIAKLGIDGSNAIKGLGQIDVSLKNTGQIVTGLGKAATTMGVATVTALTGVYVAGAKLLDQQAKIARSAEGTVAAIDALNIASARSGAEAKNVTEQVLKLNQALANGDPDSPGVKALQRLKLSADDLRSMDADERIVALSKRFQELGYTSAQIVNELKNFQIEGKEIAKIMLDGGSAIESARSELKSYGLELTQIDAYKVEAANDAFDRIGTITSGVSKKFAAEFSPVVMAASNMLADMATEGDGAGSIVTKAVDGITDALIFAANGVDGVKRAFEIAGQIIAGAMHIGVENTKVLIEFLANAGTAARATFNQMKAFVLEFAATLIEYPIKNINKVIEALNKIPGVEIEAVDSGTLVESVRAEAKKAREAADQQLASIGGVITLQDVFKAQTDNMINTTLETADQIQNILMRPLAGDMLRDYIDNAKAGAEEVAAAKVEAEKKARDNVVSITKNLTDAQIAERTKNLESLYASYETEGEALRSKMEAERTILEEAKEAGLISDQEFLERRNQVVATYENALTDIEREQSERRAAAKQAEMDQMLNGASRALGDLSTLMDTNSRKQFEVGKAAAKAKAVVDTYSAATGAYSSLSSIPIVGPALGAAAAAAAVVAGMARVRAIDKQQFKGGSTPSASAVSGGGGGSFGQAYPGAGGGGGQQAAPTRSTNINIQTSDPNGVMSTGQLVSLVEQINTVTKEGRAVLNVSNAA